jgi:hypothetical protein
VAKELASVRLVNVMAGRKRCDDVRHQLAGGEIQSSPAELAQTALRQKRCYLSDSKEIEKKSTRR